MNASKLCAAVAVVCFVLAVFSVTVGSIPFVTVGLAFLAAAHLF